VIHRNCFQQAAAYDQCNALPYFVTNVPELHGCHKQANSLDVLTKHIAKVISPRRSSHKSRCNRSPFVINCRAMSGVSSDLEHALTQLDPRSAILLEQLVRDALALVRENNPHAAVDPNGWPVGHFEKYIGCLAGDDWQPPLDPPPESVPTF
jgi:hypothetical protein